MKILITGVTGFVGSHLAEYCIKKPNVKVYGTFLVAKEVKNIEPLKGKIIFLKCDLTKKAQVIKLISEIKPDKNSIQNREGSDLGIFYLF